MKGPEDLVEAVRARIESVWSAKATAINATVTDGATLETTWGSIAFDRHSLAASFQSPMLGLMVEDGDIDLNGMTGGDYFGLTSFPLEFVVAVKSDITTLSGHGLVTDSADTMKLRLYRYLQGLVEVIAESGQTDIAGYVINGRGRYSFSSFTAKKGAGAGMYAVGTLSIPFANSES